ncbi:Fur family transcriptional regulator [Syntrophomonas erecta]
MNTRKIEQLLRMNGIRPSHHRMKVYEYLIENRNHPNVDMIYRELIKDIPTLSKTTLYNTLDLFLQKGIVQLITINENEMRYDADTSVHGHFKCNTCGIIYDIRLREPLADFESLNNFQVSESHLYFRGICPACLVKA